MTKEGQTRSLMSSGIILTSLALLWFTATLPAPSVVGPGIVSATGVLLGFYGLWSWEVYRKKRLKG